MDSGLKAQTVRNRLLTVKMSLLTDYPLYGLLLSRLQLHVDEDVSTALTDGDSITFGLDFAYSLNREQITFVMLHEILHVVLNHLQRFDDYDNMLAWNIACDLVINSIIMESHNNGKEIFIDGQPLMHLTPDGKEGRLFTAEEIYEEYYLREKQKQALAGKNGKDKGNSKGGTGAGGGMKQGEAAQKSSGDEDESGNDGGKKDKSKVNVGRLSKVEGYMVDDHTDWKPMSKNEYNEIVGALVEAVGAINARYGEKARGFIPGAVQSAVDRLLKPKKDWRAILNEFIQDEINDYSFMRTDNRYGESDFFLPDFSDTEAVVRNIHFWLDTSGSMSDDEIAEVYSEVYGAVQQFNEKLEGYLGFFDAKAYPPIPFSDIADLKKAKPIGRGGTDFAEVFKYIQQHFSYDLPVAIIIMTDGFCPFPDEKEAMGVPVLWVINNQKVTPPYGKLICLAD